MAFTDEEKANIRYHLGYPNVSTVATFALGVPAAIEPSFILENAMNVVLLPAESRVRKILETLDKVEDQMVDDLDLLAVNQVDEIQVREKEQEQLVYSYMFWRNSLANLFGVVANPYDKRFFGTGAMGINVPVLH